MVVNTAKLSSSNVLLYLLPVLVTPILTRLYPMRAFAEWGIFSSVISVATLALFLGWENTIVKVTEDKVKDVLRLCLLTASVLWLVVGVLLTAGTWLEWAWVAAFPAPVQLMLYFLFYAVYTLLYGLCNRYELYNALSLNTVVQGISQAFFRLLLGFCFLTTINGLITGVVISQAVCAVWLLWVLWRRGLHWSTAHSTYSWKRLKALAAEQRNFPLYDAPSSLLAFAAFNVPLLLLQRYFADEVIGCYTMVLQLMLLPMSFVGGAIGKVYYQRICQASSTADSISSTTQRIAQFLAFVAIVPILVVSVGGDQLIVWYLGSQWQMASTIALCLSVWAFSIILTQPLLPLFRRMDKQRTLLWFDVAYSFLALGSIFVGCRLTQHLISILLAYSLLCLVVKLSLFLRLLSLAQLSLACIRKALPLWLLAFVLLSLRLLWLW